MDNILNILVYPAVIFIVATIEIEGLESSLGHVILVNKVNSK